MRDGEARYRGIVESTQSGVAVYEAVDDGADFLFLEFNQAAENIENISRHQVIGQKVTAVFPGVEDFGIMAVFRRVWQTGKPEYFPVEFYQDDRIIGWRENYIYKLPSGEVVAVYTDQTERKQAEIALQESEARFRRLAENAKDMIYRMSLPDGKYEYISPATLEIMGYTPQEWYENPRLIEKIIHPDWHDYFRREWENLLAGKSGVAPGCVHT